MIAGRTITSIVLDSDTSIKIKTNAKYNDTTRLPINGIPLKSGVYNSRIGILIIIIRNAALFK